MPFILGTNSIKDTGYDVANSLRFNDGSSDALIRTLDDPGGAGNRNKWTFSTWLKRGTLGTTQWIFGSYQNSNYYTYIRFKNDKLDFADLYNGSFNGRRETNRLFRDPSAWMHLVFIWDKDNSTTDSKMRIYVNGTEETSFATSSAPSNATTLNADGQDISIGQQEGVGTYFDGYLCETVFNDGQAYTADNYGQFDSDSPTIWKPKDVSGLTFGTNGFYLDFENSSSLGADVSGNSNNFTVNNLTSVDQSTDTCTNNYAIFNGLLNTNATLSEGNLQAQSPASGGNGGISTFGASKGKWYAEFKQVAESTANEGALAVIDTTFLHNSTLTSAYLEYTAGTYGLRDNLTNGSSFYTDSGGSVASTSNFHGGWTTNDIIGIALDIDNNRVYFSKNGQWTDGSGNWDESNPTGYLTIQSTHGEGTYMFAVGDSSSANNVTWAANFGSPPYSISSGNSDANGYGNFEYTVPSGYYALNTKNLAEFG